ncbi:MAG: hypothetical protein LBJ78_02625 [Puniceicoccales bacterium]|jgi:hypothetical protein|nr:hypothetical protein [Puniceicoccales bacterium]
MNINIKKIINTIIKTSLVTVGMTGGVTLNAWWCEDCQMEHTFDMCPNTTKFNNSDIRLAHFPHVGYVKHEGYENKELKEDAVYGPVSPDSTYRTWYYSVVEEVAGQWLYATTCPGIFAERTDKGMRLFDRDGNPLEKADGIQRDGYLYYELPEYVRQSVSAKHYCSCTCIEMENKTIIQMRETADGIGNYYPVKPFYIQ